MLLYVLDTTAVLCVLYQEAGADQVLRVLDATRSSKPASRATVLLPFIVLMEAEYKLLRHLPLQEAQRQLLLIESWPTLVVESNPRWRSRVAQVKSKGGLSTADAWVAALALMENAELVHKDPEFDRVTGLRMLRLPYRPKSS